MQHRLPVQEGTEQAGLPVEALALYHLQEPPLDVLSVGGHQHPFLRCSVQVAPPQV